MKFTRRKDLDSQARLTIILSALSCTGTYGAMTRLALQYKISRTFLYQLVGLAMLCLNDMVRIDHPIATREIFDLKHLIVLLRLEGKCSISSISDILNKMGYRSDSTGMVSQFLKSCGERLPETLTSTEDRHVIYLSDEIFAGDLPILITIDAQSTAILKIQLASNRQAKTWKAHFKQVEENHLISKALGSDRGIGITQGYKEACPNMPWYSDHFHEFRDLFKLLIIIEKKAYAAIKEEQECQRKFDNACSEAHLQKRLEKVEKATKVCIQRIDFYERVEELVPMITPLLYFFDTHGKPHGRKSVKEELLIIMDLLDELQNASITAQTQRIRNHIDDIVLCYQQVEEVYQRLNNTLAKPALDFLCLAWQHEHLSHQSKSAAKHYHEYERDVWLEYASPLLGKRAEDIIRCVFGLLNKMVRASSLIEMVNSLIRPYLNTCKGQITQEMLNLVMFFHNHRPYKSGKRKGKAPIELLTGKMLEKNWIDTLFDTLSQDTL